MAVGADKACKSLLAIVVPLVKATQELNKKVEEQRQVISQQEKTIENYEAVLGELTDRMNALEVEVRENSATKQVVNK